MARRTPAKRPARRAATRGSGGIQSLERAFSILERIAAASPGIGLTELGRDTGLHTSTAFHLLKTMQTLGYVSQDDETKRYRVGHRALRLVGSAGDLIDTIERVEPFVVKLATMTGHAAHYAVRAGDDIQVVARADGDGAFRLNDRMAVGRPAHATAIGKILLAFLPASALDRYLRDARLEPFTDRTITDRHRLRDALRGVAAAGEAVDDREFHADLRCLAMPVRDYRQRVVGALGISAPAWQVSLAALREKRPILRDAAAGLSQSLGAAAER